MAEDLLDAREPVQRRLSDLLDDHAHRHGGLAVAPGIVRHAGGGADEARAETVRQFRGEAHPRRRMQPVIDGDHDAGIGHDDLPRTAFREVHVADVPRVRR
jgi:hypothetical protein